MPYIERDEREVIDDTYIPTGRQFNILTPGQLNYILTRFVSEWLGESPNYARYNAALGVLEAVKQELYRRQIAPYEDKKCEQNGDVY